MAKCSKYYKYIGFNPCPTFFYSLYEMAGGKHTVHIAVDRHNSHRSHGTPYDAHHSIHVDSLITKFDG